MKAVDSPIFHRSRKEGIRRHFAVLLSANIVLSKDCYLHPKQPDHLLGRHLRCGPRVTVCLERYRLLGSAPGTEHTVARYHWL